MKLLIIESPGKQKTIQKYLGSDWRVVASLGHIRGLEQSIEFIKNDFEPKYEFLKEKAKAIKELKEKAKEADEIYLGADKDYEGEQIAYSVALLLKLDPKTANRVIFTEITEKALKYAIENPSRIDMNRVNTQKARAVLDMMIGFTMSPILWRYVAPSLSAGRCQIPALRLIVEREDEINSFKSSSSWKLSGMFSTNLTKSTNFIFKAEMEDELEDEESAQNYLELIHQTPNAHIISNDIRPWSEKAPEPLITSTLQQQASALYGINPKSTMKIAQRLYEAGYITYMRTDKAIISEDATIQAKQWVTQNYGEEFVATLISTAENLKKTKKTKVEEGTKAQEAHEAIRPTHIDKSELSDGGDWSNIDKKIYNLIWQRTIQSVMSPAHGEICYIKLQIDSHDKDFNYLAKWKHTLFEGWKRVGKVAEIDETVEDTTENTENTEWKLATNLKIGDKLQWKSLKAEPKETKARGRYTEATLVRELEKFGIGRPSTFASLLTTIQDRNYVELKDIPAKEVKIKEYTLSPFQFPPEEKEIKKKVGAEKNKLIPTDLGRSVLGFMLKHFEDLFNYRFTSGMEKRLDKIAEGVESWKQVLRDMWDSYKERYQELMTKQSNSEINTTNSSRIKEFTGGLKAIQTRKGPLLLVEGKTKEETQFLGWPKGITFEEISEEIASNFRNETTKQKLGNEIGLWNEQPIIKKKGKFGEYLQCGEICIPYQIEESIEKTIERFETKSNGGSGILKQFKDYVVRTGQYGPYIMKTSLKKPQFVSLSKEIDITKLTEKEVETLYKVGLESKRKYKK